MILLGVVFIKTSSWVDRQRGPGIPLEALISDYLLSLRCHQTWLRNSQQKWRCWQCWWEKSEIHLKIGNFPLPSLITSRVSVGDDIWKIGQKKLFRCSDIYSALIVKVRSSPWVFPWLFRSNLRDISGARAKANSPSFCGAFRTEGWNDPRSGEEWGFHGV